MAGGISLLLVLLLISKEIGRVEVVFLCGSKILSAILASVVIRLLFTYCAHLIRFSERRIFFGAFALDFRSLSGIQEKRENKRDVPMNENMKKTENNEEVVCEGDKHDLEFRFQGSGARGEIEELESQITDFEINNLRECFRLNDELIARSKECRNRAREIQDLKSQIGHLEYEHSSFHQATEAESRKKVESVTLHHNMKIAQIRLDYESRIRKVNHENLVLRKKIHEDYNLQIQELSKQHETDKNKFRSSLEKTLKRKSKEHGEEIRKLSEEIELQKKDSLDNVKVLTSHNSLEIEEMRESYHNEFGKKGIEMEKMYEQKVEIATKEERERNKKCFEDQIREEKQRHLREMDTLRMKQEESFIERMKSQKQESELRFEKKYRSLSISNNKKTKELKTRKEEEISVLHTQQKNEKMIYERDLERMRSTYEIKIEEKRSQITSIKNEYEMKIYQIIHSIQENVHIETLSNVDDFENVFKKCVGDVSDYSTKLLHLEHNINRIKKHLNINEPKYKIKIRKEEERDKRKRETETLKSRIQKIKKKVMLLKVGDVNELSSYREPKPICVKIVAFLFQIIQLKDFLSDTSSNKNNNNQNKIKEYIDKKEYQKLWLICKKHLSTRIRKELVNFEPEKVFMRVNTKQVRRELNSIRKEEVLRTSCALYVLYQFLVTAVESIDQLKMEYRSLMKKRKRRKKNSKRLMMEIFGEKEN